MTDILEQAREIVASATHCDDVLRCNSVEFPCPCREAASAILALAEPKWREIDSAPKNGEEILAFARGDRNYYGVAQWSNNTEISGSVAGWFWPFAIRPTHWMRLPLPPKEEQR